MNKPGYAMDMNAMVTMQKRNEHLEEALVAARQFTVDCINTYGKEVHGNVLSARAKEILTIIDGEKA